MEINCSDLGIADCTYTAYGETAGDAVEDMVEHLRAEHDLNMPDADEILEASAQDRAELEDVAGRKGSVVLGDDQDFPQRGGEDMVTRRLLEILNREKQSS